MASAKEKLEHYKKRIEEIKNRENLIYQNYEIAKKLPKIIHSPKSSENAYFLKEIYHKPKPTSISATLRNSISQAFNSERSKLNVHSFDKKEKNLLTEESGESIQSMYSASQNDENLRKIKEVSGYYKNLKQDIGNKQNVKKIFNKKSLNIMNECEFRLENKERLSELSCYNFILSKLAPKDYEEIKKKIQILQISRKKNNSLNPIHENFG